MTTTATPGLDERLRRLKPVDLYGTGAMNYLVPPYLHDEIVAALTAPAGGEVRALREALEPFAKLADEIDALNHEEHSTCLHRIAATDLRRAKTVLASLPPAEAAQAGEAEPLSVTEVMQRVSDHCNKHEGKTQAPFSIKGMRLLLAEIQHLRGVLKERSTPSREEGPTDEQVERAQAARIDYMTRNGQGYTSDAAMRAALKAAGPSAQQRVSEEMVERLMVAGWNACRKSIYAVCEDVGEEADRTRTISSVGTASEEQHAKGYHAGMHRAAKSIARGFNSMEARDDDNLTKAIEAALSPENGGA